MTPRCAALSAALVVATAAWRPALAQVPQPMPPQPAKDSITAALVALGDSVFHGRVGRETCVACHGAAGQRGSRAAGR